LLIQHFDLKVRFDQQEENSESYLVPFIEMTKPMLPGTTVMEVGTGEGGVLKPFINHGCYCVGVDLAEERIATAKEFLANEVNSGKAEFICQNIYDDEFLNKYRNFFDVVILKDVIEHVPEQEKFIPYLRNFLKPGGQIFFGFPPWQMPFGGHQQACRKKWASVIPWYHLLPRFMYKGILNMAGEHPSIIKELLELKDTGITIERFERIIKKSGLKVLNKRHYLINPIYKYKFGLKPRKQWPPLSWIPYFRDFVTTCVYYTVG
jgi:SAM-dependent methyltransferase